MGFLYSQLFGTPAYPKTTFTGQTVIVTGSNVGLGLEGARHFTRLDAKKVILAVRNMKAGEDAKKSIEASTGRQGVVEVWNLDLGSYASVKAFATRAKSELDRIDVLCENAGISTPDFKIVEDNESTVTVNVVSTFLLALLMLPKLQESADKYNIKPRLTIVSSEVHAWASFKERSESNIYEALSDPKRSVMTDRYQVSKLLEVFAVRKIATLMSSSKNSSVILNMLNPGLCHSSLARSATGLTGAFLWTLKALLARTTEAGSRTLVYAGLAGPESHGQYMTDGHVTEEIAPWIKTDEGKAMQEKLWKELSAKLEKIEPGVTKCLE